LDEVWLSFGAAKLEAQWQKLEARSPKLKLKLKARTSKPKAENSEPEELKPRSPKSPKF